nr:von Willebrand factor A domain-containing protein 3B isoform X2 [Hydra vulgaris]
MNKNINRKSSEKLLNPFFESVTSLVSSKKWLETNGLKKLKLDLPHIMSAIGIKTEDDYIRILKKSVSSKYGNSLFKRIPLKDGSVYNLTASTDELVEIENTLKKILELYKSRFEWLVSGSRKLFGIIEGRSICIILDINPDDKQALAYFIKCLISLLKQQLVYVEKFNFIRAASEIITWQPHCVTVTPESVSNAVSWIMDLDLDVKNKSSTVLECLFYAINDTSLDAIYIFTDGSLCKSGINNLLEKIKDIYLPPIHVSVLNCINPEYLKFLRKFAKATHGRFNNYNNKEKEKSITNNSMSSDVILMLKEINEAQSIFLDIQTILKNVTQDLSNHSVSQHTQPSNEERHLSSKDWLNSIAGLSKNHLLLNHFLKEHVVHDCEDFGDHENEEKPSNKSCDSFSHVKFNDGIVKHIQITESMINEFKNKVTDLVNKYEFRIKWLKEGSRAFFGNILEKKVVLLVDTSSSMEAKLYQVKKALCKVIQEQLPEKEVFNILHFNSEVHMWKSEMMDCSEINFKDATVWVKSLFAAGSTNTLEALQSCYTLKDIEGIYLLSDGRPDQPCEEILNHINSSIPIHSISYNCDDEQANGFLYELSRKTSGRYHCFFENEFSIGEKFQSEDLHLIKKEIKKAQHELEKSNLLQKAVQQKNAARKFCLDPNKLKNRPVSAYVDNKSSLLRTKVMNENEDKQENKHNSLKAKKKKLEHESENVNNIKKWIKRYGLKACKLTITDALAPTIISRKPAYIPVLGKDVLSKVFGEAIPVIKTVSGLSKELHAINLHVLDLDSYEEKLNNWFKVIISKMTSYIISNMPVEVKEKMNVEKVYEYSECKEMLFQSYNENELPEKIQKDLNLLEAELERGHVFLKQSTDLKEFIKQMDKEKIDEKEDNLVSVKPKMKDVGDGSMRFRYHRVLARNDFDGYYYLALVKKYLNSRFVNVCFDNGEEQIVSVRYVISVGGSRPCPSLKIGDHVLARCQSHESLNGEDDCYKPGIVQVTPVQANSSLNFHTVVLYNGMKITLLRKDMSKISRARFVQTVRFIQEAVISSQNEFRLKDFQEKETQSLSDESSVTSGKSEDYRNAETNSVVSEDKEQDVYDVVSIHSEYDMDDTIKKLELTNDLTKESYENNTNLLNDLTKESYENNTDLTKENFENKLNLSLNEDDFFGSQSEQTDKLNENELLENDKSRDLKNDILTDINDDSTSIKNKIISVQLLEELQQKINEHQKYIEMKYDLKFQELSEQANTLQKIEEFLCEKIAHQTDLQKQFQLQISDDIKQQELLLQKQLQMQYDELQNKKEYSSNEYLQSTKELLYQHEQLIKQILENQQHQLVQQNKEISESQEVNEKKESSNDISPLLSYESKDDVTDDFLLKDIPWSSTPSDVLNSRSEIKHDIYNTNNIISSSEKQHTNEKDNLSSELKVLVHPLSEAVLLAQGDSGLFVSRTPLESGPVVQISSISSPLAIGKEVLGRFKNDGLYYKGIVRRLLNSTYVIEDGFGDVYKVERDNIIFETADNTIQIGSHVIGLYSSLVSSYAPGTVISLDRGSAINIQFYDGQTSLVPCTEVYLTTYSKFERDILIIRQHESALVGQTVVARDNKTGKYHLATVKSQILGSRNYLVEWSDQTLEHQNYVFIFGSHSIHKNMKNKSHCLAITDKDTFTYLPAIVESVKENELNLVFCDSNTVKAVESAHAFWISEHFYKDAVYYWKSKNNLST